MEPRKQRLVYAKAKDSEDEERKVALGALVAAEVCLLSRVSAEALGHFDRAPGDCKRRAIAH